MPLMGAPHNSGLGRELSPLVISRALRYIDGYWRNLERFRPHDEGTIIGLPRPYLVPSRAGQSHFAFDELYYWDSYFMALGLLDTPRESLAFDLLDDCAALLERFGIIPNGNRIYLTSRSQPPLLTSFILRLHEARPDKRRLERYMNLAKQEYRQVWMGTSQPNWRQVCQGLSRYYDANLLHDLAEAESGWDMTTRFNRRCLDFLPVDLNALLYKYEIDFAAAADILGEAEEAKSWRSLAKKRQKTVNELMWDEGRQFFFDFDFVRYAPGKEWSLAAYYTLWAGLATPAQASALAGHLRRFEHAGGLTATARPQRHSEDVSAQWCHPNGWAPLHWIAIQGLRRYGFHEDAQRIAGKWLAVNLAQFCLHGVFFEKYNVVEPMQPPKNGVYPPQVGFGWTNAVFARLYRDLNAEYGPGFMSGVLADTVEMMRPNLAHRQA